MKRKTTEEERDLFRRHVAEAMLKPATPRPKARKKAISKLGRRPQGDKDQLDGNTTAKLRRGQLVPERRIDLHGMTEEAAHRALQGFFARARADGVRLVLVITGVGNPKAHEGAAWARPSHGLLKEMVPRWLSERDFSALISGWAPAHRQHGGAGALYVYLRKRS